MFVEPLGAVYVELPSYRVPYSSGLCYDGVFHLTFFSPYLRSIAALIWFLLSVFPSLFLPRLSVAGIYSQRNTYTFATAIIRP